MKKNKKRGIGEFQIADRDKVLFGETARYTDGTPARSMYPEKIPAGAFYGRDDRGVWIMKHPVSAWRGVPAVELTRFDSVYKVWYEQVERGTATYRLIQSHLPIWDDDDKKALGAPPAPRYHNPRSMNKGFRYEQERRERKSQHIEINPAELRRVDDPRR